MNFNVTSLPDIHQEAGGSSSGELGRQYRLPLAPPANKKPHAAGLPNTHSRHIRLDKLHSIINGHSGRYGTARRIDIEMNIFIRIF